MIGAREAADNFARKRSIAKNDDDDDDDGGGATPWSRVVSSLRVIYFFLLEARR